MFIRLLIRLGLQMSSARLLLAPRTHVLLLAYTRLTDVLYELKAYRRPLLTLLAYRRALLTLLTLLASVLYWLTDVLYELDCM